MGDAKFIGIAASNDTVYALDEDGVVWEYDIHEDVWVRLAERRGVCS